MLVFYRLIMIPHFFSCQGWIQVSTTLYQKASKNRLSVNVYFRKFTRLCIKMKRTLFLNQLLVTWQYTWKKLLDSDWLRTVQFKWNTSAKSVTPVQITHWKKNNMKFFKPMTSRKMRTKFWAETLKKVFSNEEKNGFKKDLPSLFPLEYFHVYIINK